MFAAIRLFLDTFKNKKDEPEDWIVIDKCDHEYKRVNGYMWSNVYLECQKCNYRIIHP